MSLLFLSLTDDEEERRCSNSVRCCITMSSLVWMSEGTHPQYPALPSSYPMKLDESIRPQDHRHLANVNDFVDYPWKNQIVAMAFARDDGKDERGRGETMMCTYT
jgi:hypothetical protein